MFNTYENISLNHGDRVYLESWTGIYDDTTAEVCTVRGCSQNKSYCTPDESEQRAIENGHALAWTMADSVCLYGDKAVGERAAQQRRENREHAIAVHEGQRAVIEDRWYTVHIHRGNERGPRNSDPIAFIPLPQD